MLEMRKLEMRPVKSFEIKRLSPCQDRGMLKNVKILLDEKMCLSFHFKRRWNLKILSYIKNEIDLTMQTETNDTFDLVACDRKTRI